MTSRAFKRGAGKIGRLIARGQAGEPDLHRIPGAGLDAPGDVVDCAFAVVRRHRRDHQVAGRHADDLERAVRAGDERLTGAGLDTDPRLGHGRTVDVVDDLAVDYCRCRQRPTQQERSACDVQNLHGTWPIQNGLTTTRTTMAIRNSAGTSLNQRYQVEPRRLRPVLNLTTSRQHHR